MQFGDEDLRRKMHVMLPILDERARRLYAAAEARSLGRGGISAVARVSGMTRVTIRKGMAELESGASPGEGRIRRMGGGRKRAVDHDPELRTALQRLVAPVTRGDPRNSLRWTSLSTRHLAKALQKSGHATSHRMVAVLLHEMGFSLQANRKTRDGASHPDRDAQFQYISRCASVQMAAGQPVISVDTKKKELVGDFKNGGREWRPKGDPEKVRVHDFMIEELGKVSPYGVYDLARNQGWVSLGVTHDTAAFAVASIGRWWSQMGRAAYPKARTLLVTADGGGSNGTRNRLWKWELQKLADKTGLAISVCHLPPGTSKWNKIEHRMFCFITQNWRGRPLLTHAAIVSLIAGTETSTGLKIRCQLDRRDYPAGIKVSDAQLASIHLEPSEFHGEWNYTIWPVKAGKTR
ncbi:MAG: ISAzo13 family transposase [Planctomycetes bacterium]|nr:ISAzo13 family transposase [Planctomycetota bacterium]